MKNVKFNVEYQPINSSDADRLPYAPTIGDEIITDDGRKGTVVRVSWLTQDGKLTTATIHTDSFTCSLGEVAYVDKESEGLVLEEVK